jgi:hypothetical protein
MTELKRRNHYVPRFYLAGFTGDGEDEGLVWVTDQDNGKRWRSRPEGIAFERDLYRFEGASAEPDLLENAFAEMEAHMARVLGTTRTSGILPTGEDLDILLFFVALLFVRVPGAMSRADEPMKEIAKMIMEEMIASPERWRATIDRAKASGVDLGPDVSYDSMKRFVEEERFELRVNQNLRLRILMFRAEVIYAALKERRWRLLVPPAEGGDLICSDHPASIVSIDELPGLFGPGFGMLGTEVSVPLNKRLVLFGTFDGEQGTYRMTTDSVATFNSRTAMYARLLFSPGKDFRFVRHDGQVCSVADLLLAIGERMDTDTTRPSG